MTFAATSRIEPKIQKSMKKKKKKNSYTALHRTEKSFFYAIIEPGSILKLVLFWHESTNERKGRKKKSS